MSMNTIDIQARCKEYKELKRLLQKIFNYSAPSITLEYIGINQDSKDSTLQDFFI